MLMKTLEDSDQNKLPGETSAVNDNATLSEHETTPPAKTPSSKVWSDIETDDADDICDGETED